MIVPVFAPPVRIDAANVAGFAKTVGEFVARYGCMVIDCSEVVWIATVGISALDRASNTATITLVNPNPTIHLMVATFAPEVRIRHDPVSPPTPEATQAAVWYQCIRATRSLGKRLPTW